MIDDAKIRRQLLATFPFLPPHAVEMEDFEHGDIVGVTMFDADSHERIRAKANAKGRSEAEVAADLEAQMREWPVMKRRGGRPRKVA